MADPADREIRLALWKLHILHHASQRPTYGLWLLEELAEHGHHVSPGTLYPMLTRMEKNGWLTRGDAPHARARQTFRITSAGRRLLKELRRDVSELYEEVVLGREPDHDQSKRPNKRTSPR
jgi:DNA-binding PadR family transcriptional regulator